MDIAEILKKHLDWLQGKEGGERANLQGANLQGADLQGADLQGANLWGANLQGVNLWGANLRRADLQGADLQGTNLWGTNLWGADLQGTNLWGADLQGANLRRADLQGADLQGANLQGANLRGADLQGAKELDTLVRNQLSILPQGDILGFKKAAGGEIVRLLIKAEWKRSNATGRKCRAERAYVLNISGGCNTAQSGYDAGFLYIKGKEVSVPDFDEDWTKECAPGIHFFITEEEAKNY